MEQNSHSMSERQPNTNPDSQPKQVRFQLDAQMGSGSNQAGKKRGGYTDRNPGVFTDYKRLKLNDLVVLFFFYRKKRLNSLTAREKEVMRQLQDEERQARAPYK
jgi:hypothetical protein